MPYAAIGAAVLVALAALAAMGATFVPPAKVATPPQGRRESAYRFELVEATVKAGAGAAVTVRLVDEATGKPVPGAVIFISRLDMSPDGMREMTAPLERLEDTLPGYYRFETDLLMEGGWALTLAAKVPGEPNAVQDKLIVNAVR